MKNIPKNQIIWVTTTIGKEIFITTSNENRTTYNLYKKSKDGYIKIKSSTSPYNFNKEILLLTKKGKMKFHKYQHVQRFGNTEVEDITMGKCYIFLKLDGTNSSVYLNDDGELRAGSRNRELTLDKDNGGFYQTILKDDKIKKYLKKYPKRILYGEFLIPHSLKTYRENAWRKFYIFDVCEVDENNQLIYIPYEQYTVELDEFNLGYITPLKIVTNPTYEFLINCTKDNFYLIQEGKGVGEGIVIKNYNYVNKYGNVVCAKIVTSEFKEKHFGAIECPEVTFMPIEYKIVNELLTKAFVEKEKCKIENENNKWNSTFIPRLLNQVWHEFITDEIWNIIKKYKSPKIDLALMNKAVNAGIKRLMPELF